MESKLPPPVSISSGEVGLRLTFKCTVRSDGRSGLLEPVRSRRKSVGLIVGRTRLHDEEGKRVKVSGILCTRALGRDERG